MVQAQIEGQDPDGEAARLTLELTFASLEAARDYLLPFGRSLEVIDPVPLRRSIQDYAEQIAGVYEGG